MTNPSPTRNIGTSETDSTSALEYRVVSTVGHNTGGPQKPGCRPQVVRSILAGKGSFEPGAVGDAIQRAVDDGDLVEWNDVKGNRRLTRTNKTDLEELVGYQNRKENPSIEVIELASKYL